jgi:hypothetical protein
MKRNSIGAALAAITCLCSTPLEAEAPADPIMQWDGPVYRWPQSSLPAMQLSTFWEQVESQRLQRIVARGSGLEIVFDSLAPFSPISDQAGPGGTQSLVLKDSRTASAMVFFTLFEHGSFLPGAPDEDALMGYAKALVTSGGDEAHSITIVEGPEYVERHTILLGASPLLVTWQRADPQTGAAMLRTDYFFDGEGALLVVSVEAEAKVQPGVRNALNEVLRRAMLQSVE